MNFGIFQAEREWNKISYRITTPKGACQDLLDCFECVDIEMRTEIDDYFARFNKK